MKEAEEKKNKTRQELLALRQEFLVLLQKNQELPKHMQLQREVRVVFYKGHLSLVVPSSKVLEPDVSVPKKLNSLD